MSNTVQINARMNQSLRDADNTAFDSKSLSPSTFLHDAGLEHHTLSATIKERPFEEMMENSLIERWQERGLTCG